MKIKIGIKQIGMLCAVLVLAGCSGMQAFTTAARPGETISLAVGWQQTLTRNDFTVEIVPASGSTFIYNPGDARVRTVFQGYPDPVSKLVVSDRSGVTYQNAGLWNGSGYNELPSYFGNTFIRPMTGGESDWSDTFVFMDLPTAIAPGMATISLKRAGVNVSPPAAIEILSLPAAEKNLFKFNWGGGPQAGMIRAVERAPHYVVRFSGPPGIIPHSIQADFVRMLAASGNAWVTHPRGDIQSTMWSDTGSLIKVMLTPVKGTSVDRLSDFKFYVAGAVTSLAAHSIKAYDITGNPLSGFTASIQFVNN